MISPLILKSVRTGRLGFLASVSPKGHCFLNVRTASTLPDLQIFQAIKNHAPQQPAVVHSSSGRTFTYGRLLNDVASAKNHLAELAAGRSLRGERVAFLAENGYDYVVTLLSVLAHDAIALPLASSFPKSELHYILENSSPVLFLCSEKFKQQAKDVLEGFAAPNLQLCTLDKIESQLSFAPDVRLEEQETSKGGLMLYTSGTTSRPKGVVLSSSNINFQARSLVEAWEYSPSDYLLHVLPLHHIHGTVNALLTPLYAGCTIEFTFPFNPDYVWKRLASPFLSRPSSIADKPITFFTAVPTIYNRLLRSYHLLDEEIREAGQKAISPENMRLNISGSAALPVPVKAAWSALSNGNILLERYGMTEVGMALSGGLALVDRVDGSVGWPLPHVEVRLVDLDTGKVIPSDEGDATNDLPQEGEIQLRGPTVFPEYWQNPEATQEGFVESGDGKGNWFKTGDVAFRKLVDGAGTGLQPWAKGPAYFIRGRSSIDIIKTGGEKVSALEIERELLSLPQVAEAAVFGVDSDQWGQKVAAVIVLTPAGETGGRGGKAWGIMDMRRALKDRLVNYKIPQELKVVDRIPRNAMGKVNKKTLQRELFSSRPK